MNWLRFIGFALVLVLLLPLAGRGEEQRFPDFQCSITAPSGWEKQPISQPALIAAYTSPDRKKSLMLFASKQAKPGPLDYESMTQFERARSANTNDQRVVSKVVQVGGVSVYERLGRSVMDGEPATTWVRLFAGNGFFYSVQAMSIGGNAVEDAELREGMDSLRFPGGPVMPKRRAGIGPGLLAAAVVTVAVLVLFVVVRVSRKGPETTKQKNESV